MNCTDLTSNSFNTRIILIFCIVLVLINAYCSFVLCTKSVHLPVVFAEKKTFPRYCQSPKLQSYLHYFMSVGYNEAAQHISVGGRYKNKTQYEVMRTY
jgi:hypothetical protein